jgi:hypothetical protein
MARLFLNCHLAAGHGKSAARNDDWQKISTKASHGRWSH